MAAAYPLAALGNGVVLPPARENCSWVVQSPVTVHGGGPANLPVPPRMALPMAPTARLATFDAFDGAFCAFLQGVSTRVAAPGVAMVMVGSGTTAGLSALPPWGRYTRIITKPVLAGMPLISGVVGCVGESGMTLAVPAAASLLSITVYAPPLAAPGVCHPFCPGVVGLIWKSDSALSTPFRVKVWALLA